jgi:hypothetical protein
MTSVKELLATKQGEHQIRTHMKPIRALADHAFAFCCEVAEVTCEDGWGDDGF